MVHNYLPYHTIRSNYNELYIVTECLNMQAERTELNISVTVDNDDNYTEVLLYTYQYVYAYICIYMYI